MKEYLFRLWLVEENPIASFICLFYLRHLQRALFKLKCKIKALLGKEKEIDISLELYD